MAEALVKVVLENLNSLIQKQFGLLWGVQKEMDKLSSTFSTVLAVLEDAEERQFTERAVRNWLQKLSDVAFELDDVLDDCEMEAWRVENERQKRRWTQKVRSSLSGLNPMNALFHLRFANKMKKIGDRLDQIANERMKFHLREVAVGERRDQAMRERRRTSSIITQPYVYGREEDKEKIFSSLRVLQGRLITMPMPAGALISNTKHLRYLNLSGSSIEILPESICFLIHLLTLDLSNCHSLGELPKHMSRLKSLRHLYIRGCSRLLHMPRNIGRLTSLRTLTDFFLNGRKGCHLDELCHLNIGGSLSISKLEKVGSPTEAKSANLLGKRNLKRLSLCWSENENESQDNSEQVLEALAPSQNLEALSIRNYKVSENNFVQSLDNESYDGDLRNGFECLEDLELWDLPNLERLSRREGKVMFPCLSSLEVRNCPKLTILHGLSFVCLKNLRLYKLPNLERLVREEGKEMFPCLSSLNVYECSKLTLPSIASATYLYAKGVSEVLLKSISNIHGLTRLDIEINVNMTSLPQGMLRNLTALRSLVTSYFATKSMLQGFTKVQEFPSDMLTGLIALEDLTIRRCDELKCLSEGIFQTPVLKRIKIVGCKKLKSLSESFWDLTTLQSLCLVDLPELEWVPSYLSQLSSLQALNLSGLKVSSSEANFRPGRCIPHKNFIFFLEDFPHLPSLQFMRISDFPELTSLPDSFGNFVSLHYQNRKILNWYGDLPRPRSRCASCSPSLSCYKSCVRCNSVDDGYMLPPINVSGYISAVFSKQRTSSWSSNEQPYKTSTILIRSFFQICRKRKFRLVLVMPIPMPMPRCASCSVHIMLQELCEM
ncbi:hypothetical protein TIFTF001_029585 [Ficus carica]|uniref:Rx N-terminal domain-containing protein n=1 Tax=Ficus carica TaxID=3494 RepID=A0AA88IY97_FICCA|nr:hypothetical protein TIFTF001_029585 [Ficus carica]